MQSSISHNKLYLTTLLTGILLILAGLYISEYKIPRQISRIKLLLTRNIKCLEAITDRYPFKLLSDKISGSISYFMLHEIVQRSVASILTLFLPSVGIIIYFILNRGLNLWYTRLIMLALCIMLPYYIFSLLTDYIKYRLRLKIPLLIDNFRSSFMMHYRIKPALRECGKSIDRVFGRIIERVSDSSDLNRSLNAVRDRIDDTWFNIFVLLIINYRENGGELIAQLYKLNRSITRYNNIERKKNKRLIWYEMFAVLASIFSLPAIMLINKLILGVDAGIYYDTTAVSAKVILYSLLALVVVRVLRKM
jgi:Flp pilus assembly protein TadB